VVSDGRDAGRRRAARPGERATPWPAPDGGIAPGERRLLAAMPLHAITTLHGEAGLRERLALEIAGFPDADRERIGRALELAAWLHAADRRQREPYVNHLLRVAIRIISHYRIHDPDVICAALPHDTVEDHPAGLAHGGGQPEAIAALAAQFGTRTAGLVAAVTNPMDNGPSGDSHAQYREHVAASLAASPWARVIKMSDFTDNGVGLIHTTGPRIGKLAKQVRTARARPARVHRPPGHPACRRRQGARLRPARPRRAALRGDQANARTGRRHDLAEYRADRVSRRMRGLPVSRGQGSAGMPVSSRSVASDCHGYPQR